MRVMLLISVLLGGCAGVTVRPISPAQVTAAHAGKGELRGYVVYSPIVLLSVGETEVCTQPMQEGKCPSGATKRICTIGNPVVVPDFSKPFLVDIQSGFGKAGADVQIADGWRLAGVKDTSDNTALLTLLQKAAGIPFAQGDSTGCAMGLYQWTAADKEKLPKIFPK